MDENKTTEISRAHTEALAAPTGQPFANRSQLIPAAVVSARAIAAKIEADVATPKSYRELILSLPECRPFIVASAFRNLAAQKMMSGGQRGVVELCDDGATQMKAAAFLAAYSEGLPAQTVVNVNMDATKDLSLDDMLARSPALCAAMERQVAKARAVQESGSRKIVELSSEPAAGA